MIFMSSTLFGKYFLALLINDFQLQKTIFGCPAFLDVIFGYDNVIAHAELTDLNWKFTLVLFGVKKYPKTTGLCHCSFGGFPPL